MIKRMLKRKFGPVVCYLRGHHDEEARFLGITRFSLTCHTCLRGRTWVNINFMAGTLYPTSRAARRVR